MNPTDVQYNNAAAKLKELAQTGSETGDLLLYGGIVVAAGIAITIYLRLTDKAAE